MNTAQSKFPWKAIAAVAVSAVLMTMLFISFFPWLAAFTGLMLLAGSVAYAAWPPVFKKIAMIRGRACPSLQSRLYVGSPVVIYGVILLAVSQSQIRANWRDAGTRDDVRRAIVSAEMALEQQQVDETLEILSRLDDVTSDEKTEITAILKRAQTIAANNEVARLVSTGRTQLAKQDLNDCEATLKAALQVPMASEFATATKFAGEIVEKRMALAIGLLSEGEFDRAKEQAQRGMDVPSTTWTTQAKRLLIDICNREVAQLVASARKSLENKNRDEAEATLECALAIRDATATAEAEKILGGIREARKSEANSRVSTLLVDAQESFNKKHFQDALRTLSEAIAVPYSTKKSEVATAIKRVQNEQAAEQAAARARQIAVAKEEAARKAAEAKREQMAIAAAEAEREAQEAARKAELEYESNESNGLVLLRKTVKGIRGEFFGEITGEVVNRGNRNVSYAEVRFLLYDKSGAQVGNALANIEDLQAGGT
ncbi:MAG: FxLYD domain-containing protein, partial [Planctomycetota bacterium]|nr:FxLYD domain-containing protein [Planctomycetota bacterium]